ncbi:MAG: hypothetical protein ACOCT0_02905 [Halobacteriota archaeon]
MTERAVRHKLGRFVHTVAIRSLDELNPLNVLDVDVNLPGDKLKSAMRDDIRQEMASVKARFQDQADVMVDYSLERNGRYDDYLEEFLANDVFYSHYHGNGDGRESFQRELKEYFDENTENLAPLIESPEDDFWDAVRDVYGREEARDVLGTHFSRADIIEKYTDGIVLNMELDTGLPIDEMEYTDEGVRIFAVGERQMREQVDEQLDKLYG